MRNTVRLIFLRLFAALLSGCLTFACANMGNPNGGPYDEDPPRFIGSNPEINRLNFKGKKIEVFFDEFIAIENPSENVIVTPPQLQSPTIMALGKKVTVELKDTLKENTTYTIDFTSSISDNNEKNVLENFSFAFSTGDVLDTLRISGVLLNAADLEPVQKALVGIHNDLSDTTFTTTPFLRASKTDERGRFVIHNVAPGSYHLFALEDNNRNYAYDKDNNESLAFLDSIVIPYAERMMVPDTMWRDSISYDTIMMVERTIFYPEDLNLWLFTDSVTPRQRMLRPERPQDYIFTLKFNAPVDTLIDPVPLNFEPADSLWYVTQKGDDKESFAINYWILDSMIYKIDTLMIEVSYLKNNDSIPEIIELRTDTLSLVNRETAQRKRDESKSKRPVKVRRSNDEGDNPTDKEPEQPRKIPLQVDIIPSGSLNPYDIITVKFNEPVLDVRKDFFRMETGADSIWNAVDFEFEEDSMRAMTYLIKRPFKYNENYRITIDSAMLCGVYGHCNDPITVSMSVKSDKEYGGLVINVLGLPLEGDSGQVVPAFMELLNTSEVSVRKVIVENGVAKFIDIPAEKYYARITLDTNGNGLWDAGSYEEQRQPERVLYFMKLHELRQNYVFEEDWDLNTAKPGEKPHELLKNKPKEETKKKRDYREDSKPRNTRGSSSPNIRGMGGLGR